jgi:nitroimidazol reductase NimA-like FMN-containing flavoprotein (pyridoxamine 5'-phosphate oxidase superfamily)
MDDTERADPRTGLVELTPDECWRHLRAGTVGRIAVLVGSTPDIFPVNYAVHAGEIVIRTEAGTKLAAATLMGSVAFEIDGIDDVDHTGWSVVVKGRGREPSGIEERMALDELDLAPWAAAPKSRWLAIAPDEVTGRRVG